MNYLVIPILLVLMSLSAYRCFSSSNLLKKELLTGWGIKIVFSMVFMLVFTFYYSEKGTPYGDVANFLKDSKVLSEYGKEDPIGYLKLLVGYNANDLTLLQSHLAETNIWSYGDNGDLINDNRLIIKINSLIHFISFGNIWVHVLFFAFLSFLGTVLIYMSFEKFVQRKRWFFYTLLLAPTFAFWGSGLTKECLFVLAFGLFSFFIFKLKVFKRVHWLYLFGFLFSVLLLVVNKPHAGLILVPMVSFVAVSYRIGSGKKILIAFFSIIIATFIFFSLTPSKANIIDLISKKQQDLINLGKGGVFFVNDSAFCAFDYNQLKHFDYLKDENLITAKERTNGEYKLFGEDDFHPFAIQPSKSVYEVYLVIPPSASYVSVPAVGGSGLQLIKNIPFGLLNVLVRPFPTDNGSNLKYVVFLENLLFITFLIWSMLNRRRLEENEWIWLFYLVTSAIILVLVIGWTTPILGAIARYKMVPQLLLIIASFILLRGKKEIQT